MHAYTQMHTHTTQMHTHIHTLAQTHTHICIQTHAHTYMHENTHACMHTHMYAHTIHTPHTREKGEKNIMSLPVFTPVGFPCPSSQLHK